MFVFMWEYLPTVSDCYHSGGGLVVIAESLEKARELLREKHCVPTDCEAFTKNPDVIHELTQTTEPIKPYFCVFPDAGCC